MGKEGTAFCLNTNRSSDHSICSSYAGVSSEAKGTNVVRETRQLVIPLVPFSEDEFWLVILDALEAEKLEQILEGIAAEAENAGERKGKGRRAL